MKRAHLIRAFVVLAGMFLTILSGNGLIAGQPYYCDAASGSDTLDGQTPATAWQSLNPVNAKTFLPGDTIYFKSGSVWTGMLSPKGSGTSGLPIIIAMYGGTAHPLINGGGFTGRGTFYLSNQQYWEVNDLELTNTSTSAVAGDRRGVLVTASNFGTVHHIVLRNLVIHDVTGIVGQDDASKRTGGIGIETGDDTSVPTRYDDILIDGCIISSLQNTGIYTDNQTKRSDYPRSSGWNNRRFTNVRISNNVIHHISKNAMIIRLFERGVIEHNVCYETATAITGNTMFTASCWGTVFQYNEGYLNRSPDADGSMYDADLRSPYTFWQYSYSHDNAHGLFWTCTVQEDTGVVCRYNISQNDHGNIFCINYPVTSVACYNNTVYVGSSYSPLIISERNVQSGTRSYSFRNNIIYNLSPTAGYDFRSNGYTRVFDHNVFFGEHPGIEPEDANALTGDPLLVAPGSAGAGITSTDGYRLQEGSPCIDSGIPISVNNGGKDYFGNPVPAGSGVDRGACEYQPPAGVKEHGQVPEGSQLDQNYPNPFNPVTRIRFTLSHPSFVTLRVLDLNGREVRTLAEGRMASGGHEVMFDASGCSSGVYFYTLTSDQINTTRRLLFVK